MDGHAAGMARHAAGQALQIEVQCLQTPGTPQRGQHDVLQAGEQIEGQRGNLSPGQSGTELAGRQSGTCQYGAPRW